MKSRKTTIREDDPMNDDAKLSRRRFAQIAGATTLAGPTIVSARALGREDQAAAGERITLGFIGMGTMNRHHVKRPARRARTSTARSR
jgi:hypothetical protein